MNKSVIVFGPAGCGKTTHASRLSKCFGLDTIVDDADLSMPPAYSENTLYLVRERPAWAPEDDGRIIEFRDAMALARHAESQAATL